MGLVEKWIGLAILVGAICSMSMFKPSEGKGFDLPLNCLQLECAPYKVIDSQKEFEIRSYKDAMWVSTAPINSSSYMDGAGKGFNILFSYIQGKNDEAAKINMTAPVFVDIIPSTGRFRNSSFVVHFYIPQKYQKKPPKSRQAHPTKLPNYKYAVVRRFGGFVDANNIQIQALALRKSLNSTKWESYIMNKNKGHIRPYTIAGYNSPFEYENRVNEVMFWFDKK